MIDEKRFGRLEDKVDRVDDKVDSVRVDVAELRSDIRHFTTKVERHVAGDDKIITEIQPVLRSFQQFMDVELPKLQSIVEQVERKRVISHHETVQENKKMTKIKWGIGITASLVGIVATIYKMGIF